jgi:hypothetical protein
MTTIGEVISRIRNQIKAVDADSFITDRVIYSNIMKYAKMYIKRQDAITSRAKFNSLFTRLPCVDLIEVDRVEACCDINSGVTVMRTKEKLPGILDGASGPLLRFVGSIDTSVEAFRTTPQLYNALQKTSGAKYNKNKYYWLLDGYLYLPNVVWPSIAVDGIFEDSLNIFKCDSECKAIQTQVFSIPSELFAEIEQQVTNDFMKSMQINNDPVAGDKQSPLRA